MEDFAACVEVGGTAQQAQPDGEWHAEKQREQRLEQLASADRAKRHPEQAEADHLTASLDGPIDRSDEQAGEADREHGAGNGPEDLAVAVDKLEFLIGVRGLDLNALDPVGGGEEPVVDLATAVQDDDPVPLALREDPLDTRGVRRQVEVGIEVGRLEVADGRAGYESPLRARDCYP